MLSDEVRVAHWFAEYYKREPLDPPPLMGRREWAFVPFASSFQGYIRHRQYDRIEHLRKYLIRNPPKSIFHSMAYYRRPSERRMDMKEVKGADLVFDLDGDHLSGITDENFEMMIRLIQAETWRLWDTFLKRELGVNERHLEVTFSGHRGFHLHIRDPSLQHLDARARREIVEYIRGKDLDSYRALRRALEQTSDARGWPKRLLDNLPRVISQLSESLSDDRTTKTRAKKELERYRSMLPDGKRPSKPAIERLAQRFETPSIKRQVIDERNIEVLGGGEKGAVHRDTFVALLHGASMGGDEGSAEIDDVVTIDMHRIIRWKTSLHGKTGMRVTTIPVERLDPEGPEAFDPLSETIALPSMGQHELVGVVNGMQTRIHERHISIEENKTFTATTAEAAFLILKGWAKFTTTST